MAYGMINACNKRTNASDTSYDNTTSGLGVSDVQAAIDSVYDQLKPTLIVNTDAGATLTITDGNSTVTATVEDSGSVEVKLPNIGEWTVKGNLNGKIGEAQVEFIYLGQTQTITLELHLIYGASWDGTSTTSWTRTDSAADFTDPVPYISGASSYSSPFDDIQPWAGMTVSERTGGTMVSIPKFWYKLTQDGSGIKIQIANEALDGYSVSPAHMDRGDGNGERDVVYIGRYHCGSTAYKSVAGETPKVSITRSTARTNIAALGDGIS